MGWQEFKREAPNRHRSNEHGTRYMARNRACGCAECMEYRRIYQQAYRVRRAGR